VERLLAEGWTAVAHVRPDSKRLAEERARFEQLGAKVDTTPWQEAALCETLRTHAPAAVFSLLGTTQSREKKAGNSGGPAGYEAVDYGLTAMLLRAAKASGSSPRFIYLSAAAAASPGSPHALPS
jgi:nucleoside-diphosphate-sugar epimerase